MIDKLKFNRYNLIQEIEEYGQTVSEFAQIMAQKKKEYIIAEKSNQELSKYQKELLKIKFAEIYKKLQEEDPKTPDTKLKQLVLADKEYKDFLNDQNSEMVNSIIDLGIKEEEMAKSTSNYYASTNKIKQIEEAIKLLIGGHIGININKIQEEVKTIKKTKLKTLKKTKEAK